MSEEIRILKIGICPSLSKRSSLTYHIGAIGQEVYIRLVENSARGLFSKDWIPIKEIKLSVNATFAASSLHELFKGRSINTVGFMMAVLKNEGLIKNAEDRVRSYMGCDPTAFNVAIQELMASDVSLNDRPLPAKKPARRT